MLLREISLCVIKKAKKVVVFYLVTSTICDTVLSVPSVWCSEKNALMSSAEESLAKLEATALTALHMSGPCLNLETKSPWRVRKKDQARSAPAADESDTPEITLRTSCSFARWKLVRKSKNQGPRTKTD